MRRKLGETFQFRLTHEDKDRLEQLAAWHHISLAEALREAIDCYWRQETHRKERAGGPRPKL